MKFTFQILFLSSLLLSSTFAHATASSETNVYIAALTQLLEQKTIGDAELVTLLEAAEDGKVVNPISPVRAETSVEHFAANNALEELLLGEIDAAKVVAWAVANIKEQDQLRQKRKQTKEETKQLWKEVPSVLSAGAHHSCAITIFGTVRCWGNDDHGQASPPPGIFKSVSAGNFHSCGVKMDGKVECWGSRERGACDAPSDLFDFVSAASERTCGITMNGTLKCWGEGYPSPAPSSGFRSVSAEGQHTCGVRTNNAVECWWGDEPYSTPPGIFQSVSTAGGYACGVRASGSIQCWAARNSRNQYDSPPGIFQSVTVGGEYPCGLKIDGMISCWATKETAPSGVFHSISSGGTHFCGVRTDGVVECWVSTNGTADWISKNLYGQASPPWFLLAATGKVNEIQDENFYTISSLFLSRIISSTYSIGNNEYFYPAIMFTVTYALARLAYRGRLF